MAESDVYKRQVDLVLNDQSVSRLHARISRDGNRFFITDLNSTNGTFRNGMRLEPVSYTHLDVYKRQIYDNPVGVLTNNPPFPQQMFQLNNYMYLSPKQPRNTDVYKRQLLQFIVNTIGLLNSCFYKRNRISIVLS